jgi:two-component system cell cycle sensor histidine kinase/response regulator CckA
VPLFRLPLGRRPGDPAPSMPASVAGQPGPVDHALVAATIGHDIRNLLTAIDLAVEMAIESVGDDHPARADLVEAIRALDMATVLTVRLLELGGTQGVERPGAVQPDPGASSGCDVADVVRAIDPILRRLVDGEWTLELDVPQAVGRVALEAASVESLVVNLVVNARDAQPDGGRIDIAVHERRPGPTAPAFVELSVADRGTGIAAELRHRIFEPRVTTKIGGSGLGLAIVADVVRAAGGTVQVSDRAGGGTCFLVLLPRLAEPVRVIAPRGAQPGGGPVGHLHLGVRTIEGEPR